METQIKYKSQEEEILISQVLLHPCMRSSKGNNNFFLILPCAGTDKEMFKFSPQNQFWEETLCPKPSEVSCGGFNLQVSVFEFVSRKKNFLFQLNYCTCDINVNSNSCPFLFNFNKELHGKEFRVKAHQLGPF